MRSIGLHATILIEDVGPPDPKAAPRAGTPEYESLVAQLRNATGIGERMARDLIDGLRGADSP